MSNSPAYPPWSTGRSQHPAERKALDGDKLAGYAAPPQFVNVSDIIKYVDLFSFSLGSLSGGHACWVRLGINLVFLELNRCHGRIDHPLSTPLYSQPFRRQAFVRQCSNSQRRVEQRAAEHGRPRYESFYLSCRFGTREPIFSPDELVIFSVASFSKLSRSSLHSTPRH